MYVVTEWRSAVRLVEQNRFRPTENGKFERGFFGSACERKMSCKKMAGTLLALCLSSQYVAAEPQKLGPLDLRLQINKIDLAVVAQGLLDLNTAKGSFNANGQVTFSAPAAQLANEIMLISKTLLPQRIQISRCELWIREPSKLQLSAKDYEAQIDIDVPINLEVCLPGHVSDHNISVSIALIPKTVGDKRLGWKVVRPPRIDGIPATWWFFLQIYSGDPNKYFGDVIQKWLDAHALIEVPASSPVDASFQGANFDGNANTISFRIKGDAHADGKHATAMLLQYLTTKSLEFNIPKAVDEGALPDAIKYSTTTQVGSVEDSVEEFGGRFGRREVRRWSGHNKHLPARKPSKRRKNLS